MADRPKGKCQSCGGPFLAFVKNRKYCEFCQAERDYKFRPGWSCKCEVCNTQVWPVRISHKRCYLHAQFRPIRPDEYPACSRCGEHKRTAPASGKGVCLDCVQSSAEMQRLYAITNSMMVDKRKKEYS